MGNKRLAATRIYLPLHSPSALPFSDMRLGTALQNNDLTKKNSQVFTGRLDRLKELRALAELGKDAQTREKQKARGKLDVWARINTLLDPGSAFLELGQLAGYNLYDGVPPGSGIVTGVGSVSGRPCMIVANDPAIKGGTYFPLTVKKHIRAQEIALENKLPCLYLVDSGGAFLPLQDEVFPDRFHFGRIFKNQAKLSSLGIPQISVVLGSCTAGGAYVPAMSDQSIIVKNQGTIFLGGPPLVKAATGEVVTAEELGGGDLHTRESGVADYLAESDSEALQIARNLVANVGGTARLGLRREQSNKPLFPASDISSLIPSDPRQPFPMREILARLIDDSMLDEFKPLFGSTLITGFARISGYLVGIIANDGILFSESALKGAHFIQLCNQRDIPIIFFQDIVGFMVGKKYEKEGIAKHGAKLVNAVATSHVPLYTLIVGNSYGAGNYGMCGRAYDPRFLFSWPNAYVGVMGAEQASSVLAQVRKDSFAHKGKTYSEGESEAYKKEISEKFSKQTDVYYGSARLWDDGVITPEETRSALTMALSIAHLEPRTTGYGVFRM